MPKPVCVPCQRFFRMRKAGFYFIEGMPSNGNARAPSGTSHPEQWKPYKIWVADRWECLGCGASILSGFGSSPLGEHYQDDFTKKVKDTGADQLQVNDC